MSKRNKEKTPDELRDSILSAMLDHVAFDGWSDMAVKQAAQDLEIKPDIIDLAFPGGNIDMIELLAQKCDLEMLEQAKNIDLDALRIREKITTLVALRIKAETPNKEQAHRALSFLALPRNHLTSMKILYRTVDLIWKAIGDNSTDFNFYTKRMTLSAVYTSTFLYWLGDDSEDATDTWAFLDRRIENVMQFEKAKAQLKNKDINIPNVWRELGKHRYGS